MNNRLLLGVMITSFFLGGCTEDFIEKNLRKKEVTLLSPANNLIVTSNAVNFWWDEIDGADKYELQVVSPGFSNLQQLILDTSLSQNKFTHHFLPGNYQGRIKALNSSSETPYTVFAFSVDTALDLTKQFVTLISPADYIETNATSVLFSWTKIAFADDYRIEILNEQGSILEVKTPVLTDTLSFTFQNEGTFQWRVQAHSNNGTSSMYSTRTIVIDRNAPQASSPNFPIDNDTISNPVILKWAREATAFQDSVFIASDTTFSTILKRDLTQNTQYTYNADTTAGIPVYFWRLKTADKAGNWSGFGTTKRFRVN